LFHAEGAKNAKLLHGVTLRSTEFHGGFNGCEKERVGDREILFHAKSGKKGIVLQRE